MGSNLRGVVGEHLGGLFLGRGAFARALDGGLDGPPLFPEVRETLDCVIDVLQGLALPRVVSVSLAEGALDAFDVDEDSNETLVFRFGAVQVSQAYVESGIAVRGASLLGCNLGSESLCD